jgi:ElaA protein
VSASLPKIALRITTQWRRFEQLSSAALYELLRFRQQIFVVEQRSPYPDLDGLDQAAWHLLGWADGNFAAYLRLLPPGDAMPAVRIGRVAVAAAMRREGVARGLMTEALGLCRERYPRQPIRLSAQLHLARFYESLGFTATAAPYDDFGVAHVEMAMSPATTLPPECLSP